jgi:hypothetical protein
MKDKMMTSDFKETLLNMIGEPLTRASLDLSLWQANHEDIATADQVFLLLTFVAAVLKENLDETRLEEAYIEITQMIRAVMFTSPETESDPEDNVRSIFKF